MCVTDIVEEQVVSGFTWVLHKAFDLHPVAELVCQYIGGTLAAPQDAGANAAMAAFLSRNGVGGDPVWIGLVASNSVTSTDKSDWIWLTTGEPPSYDVWGVGQPLADEADWMKGAVAVIRGGSWYNYNPRLENFAYTVCEVPGKESVVEPFSNVTDGASGIAHLNVC